MTMHIIDGRRGEGGGQILRTSLSISALTGRPFRLEHIRAGRRRPGLRPQHLTAVLAAAELCQAELDGATIDSQTLQFIPQSPPISGEYTWDVTDAALHGSAGAVTLIWQTVLWPLLFAKGTSKITLRGGTHVPYSPPFHYAQKVVIPSLRRFGVHTELNLTEWGWMPHGGGEFQGEIVPHDRLDAAEFLPQTIESVNGLAVATNLPGHIPHRMSRRVYNLLADLGLSSAVQAVRLKSGSTGAGLFLWLPSGQAGVVSLGRQGLAAQTVAEIAVDGLQDFIEREAAVDEHLADQLLIPMALAHGRSYLTTNRLTQHTLTNIAMLQDWLGVDIQVEGEVGGVGSVSVIGAGVYSASLWRVAALGP